VAEADDHGKHSRYTQALLDHLPTPGLDVTECMKAVTRQVLEQVCTSPEVPLRFCHGPFIGDADTCCCFVWLLFCLAGVSTPVVVTQH
jgi:hypothetical protein